MRITKALINNFYTQTIHDMARAIGDDAAVYMLSGAALAYGKLLDYTAARVNADMDTAVEARRSQK